jgi:hypothetical protein
MKASILILCLLLFFESLLPCAFGQYAPPGDVEGIPFPASEPVYHQPLGRGAAVMAGNHDPARGKDPGLLHAWDYGTDLGTPVVAARGGVVTEVIDQYSIGGGDPARFNRRVNYVAIHHLDGTYARYCNLAPGTVRVRRGEYVMQGEWIADSGDTGQAFYPKLLFVVADWKSHESVPVTFKDFRKNGGLPEKGDKVPKAAPPALPQASLDFYRLQWRACEHADMMGRTDLAWRFTLERPRKALPDHFYHQVLCAREKVLRARVLARLKELAAVTDPSDKEAFEAMHLQECLKKTKVLEVKNPLHDLKAAMQNWDNETWNAWKPESKALPSGLEGLRLECLADREKAVDQYAAALQRCRGPYEKQAKKNLERLVQTYCTEFRESFLRFEAEWEIASPGHRKRIAAAAKEGLEVTRDALEKKRKCLPEEKEEIQKRLAEMEKRYKELIQ